MALDLLPPSCNYYCRTTMVQEIFLNKRKSFVCFLAFSSLYLLFSYSNKSQCANDRKDSRRADLPMIYAITPTYTRPVQKAELTRYLWWSHTIYQEYTCYFTYMLASHDFHWAFILTHSMEMFIFSPWWFQGLLT